MNTITYSQLISYTKPYFLSRWWDSLASIDRMMFYANAAIQDIYNADNSTFLHKTETISYATDWDKHKFITTYPIRKIQSITDQNWNTLTPTLFNPTDCEVIFDGDQILASTNVTEVTVTYLKDYVWAEYPRDYNKWITLPNRYVPAIIKMMYDWASPINLMSSESSTVDFFSHWMNRINSLATNDTLTDYTDIKPRY